MTKEYSKHKDRNPRETVEFIQGILESIGLTTSLKWTSHQFDATHSNRVTVDGTSIGTNGKGTTEEYAMASGYAELIERIQNKRIIGSNTHPDRTYATHGFYEFPDERLVSAASIVERRDPVIDRWLEGWGLNKDAERLEFLEFVSDWRFGRDDGMLAEVPFVDVFSREIRWISSAVYRPLSGSNGLAAGNTLEECLVQGISEIFERHVQKSVLRGEVTPPRIPTEELEAWNLHDLINRIEEGGRYRVLVHDGSLGRGYPVIVTVMVDQYRGTFGVNCGAHPSMAVAVERTLTEAFQGRDIKFFTGIDRIAPLDEAASSKNMRAVSINGTGAYPASLFAGEPGWEYRRWPDFEGSTNSELLEYLSNLLRRDGYRLLVRNASFLGFPACRIIVPGMSEMKPNTPEGLAMEYANHSMQDALNHFPAITDEQAEQILAIESENETMPRRMPCGRPLAGQRMYSPRLFGLLHLSRGEFAAARRSFLSFDKELSDFVSLYFEVMAHYAEWRDQGLAHEEAIKLVEALYPPLYSRRVAYETAPGPDLLSRNFPRMNCYDCDNCDLASAGGCHAPADREAFAKIDAAMARSAVTQEPLLQIFPNTGQE